MPSGEKACTWPDTQGVSTPHRIDGVSFPNRRGSAIGLPQAQILRDSTCTSGPSVRLLGPTGKTRDTVGRG